MAPLRAQLRPMVNWFFALLGYRLQSETTVEGRQQKLDKQETVIRQLTQAGRTFPLFVAKKRWGPSEEIVESKEIEVGWANQGIIVHSTSSGNRFVEKRTKLETELHISLAIKAAQSMPPLGAILKKPTPLQTPHYPRVAGHRNPGNFSTYF